VDGAVLPGRDAAAPRGAVQSLPSGYDRMTFDVESSASALLVVSSSYHPGWSATVDGRPVRVNRANWVEMGIPVPAGRSRVELRYHTPGLVSGALLTLACGLVAAFWIGGWKLGRSRR
jgi:uncharacterized membrane protein YfhO